MSYENNAWSTLVDRDKQQAQQSNMSGMKPWMITAVVAQLAECEDPGSNPVISYL